MSRKIQAGDKVVFSEDARDVDYLWYTAVKDAGVVGIVTRASGNFVDVGWFLETDSVLPRNIYGYTANELKVLGWFDLGGYSSYRRLYEAYTNLPTPQDS